ncbi:glycosyltransferase family 4 protein [Pedobacter boryungensis]|uniref:Glycosyltransferase family 4 protein n=1 Tax=Pedobacter boryungensis TaxID=869962 RepID=A0ABX2D7Y9_9SPHI|nr:glycosyltransferase family 4 protein [Pedobacter boryungensis]NQX30166.1 glycosyltransferase family 4 protein [Pedobacter boryungensis]
MTKKLAIISTHPIQYYAPVFQLLAKKIDIKVFYTAGNALEKYDIGFKQKIEWDIPLLEGYKYEFLENSAKDKGSHHFTGVVNPNAIEQIKNYQPNAILIYGWAYKSHLKIIRFFKNKIPVYFRGDSTLLNQKSDFKNLLRNLFLTWVYKNIDAAFYVGSANKAYFKKYGLKDEQLIFAPHAIDNKRFGENRQEEASKLRAKFGIKEEEILVLFAGKLESVKNPMLLLSAFQKLNSIDIHLLFVGNGELEKSLKEQTKENGQPENIHFLDFQNQTQMPTIYQACDLFCLPSNSETWGLAINEAMASGKPILVSDKVGCAVDLVNAKTGSIFKHGDLTDLTQKLIALTQSKSQLKKMGENSLKYINNWSFEEQVNAIIKYVNRSES